MLLLGVAEKPLGEAVLSRYNGSTSGAVSFMQLGNLKNPVASTFYRCAGPNCGILKRTNDRWWLMWTSAVNYNQPVLYLSAWDDELANREGTIHVCGELCAQKLQSQFMGNIRESQLRKLSVGH